MRELAVRAVGDASGEEKRACLQGGLRFRVSGMAAILENPV